ncbi:Non-ribosomal peptide synthetase module, pyoverdine [Minicystis rosea]|nr:Non-ribosomal peptide synthetase module, pyoverdine [Minicystis rosea]
MVPDVAPPPRVGVEAGSGGPTGGAGRDRARNTRPDPGAGMSVSQWFAQLVVARWRVTPALGGGFTLASTRACARRRLSAPSRRRYRRPRGRCVLCGICPEDSSMTQIDWSREDGDAPPLATRGPDAHGLLSQIDTSCCLHELFEAAAQRTPDAVALSLDNERLTYRALDARGNQLAHELVARGVGPNALVGVCLDRSIDMIVAILGVLKAGGAYVPIDLEYPRERISFMIADARARVVITQPSLSPMLQGTAAEIVVLTPETGIGRDETKPPPRRAGPQDAAYVIYTSGSTGQPKGVVVEHRHVTRLMATTWDWFHFGPEDVWTLFHSFSFDFSVWEIWGALLFGGRLVIVPHRVSRSPAAFHDLLRREQVTVLNQTPSAFRQLIHAEGSLGPAELAALRLRIVILGGEALDPIMLRPFWDRHGDRTPRVINMYGPTETTVFATYRPMRRADLDGPGKSMIGVPLPDLRIHLLDTEGIEVPDGVPGEIHIGGAGVARGYLHRPALTAERFLPDRVAGKGRLYRTGDLARRTSSGDLEYLGRTDDQVKIRGFRIELGEIEAVLARHPSVRESVVAVREDERGDKRLAAYLVFSAGRPYDEDLAALARRHLPEHMVPSAFEALTALPLTLNGKVDRRALPAPSAPRRRPDGFVPSRDEVELRIAALWKRLLCIDTVGMRDSFFDLGGHSMLAVAMMEEIERTFGKKIPLVTLFEAPTIEALSCLLREEGSARAWPRIVPIKPTGTRRPLFLVSRPNVNSLGYAALATRLDRDRPVYGLQCEYPDEAALGRPYTRDEYARWATQHIERLREVQPRGPYYLGGMCEGALIAFDMARRLEAAGEQVALLSVFDAWPEENTRSPLLWEIYLYEQRLRWLLEVDHERRMRFLENRVRRALGLGSKRRARNGNPWRVRIEPMTDFVAPKVTGRIAVFRVERQPYWRIQDDYLGWRERTSAAVEIHPIAGKHHNFLRPRFVGVLAAKLDACLRRRDQELAGDGG